LLTEERAKKSEPCDEQVHRNHVARLESQFSRSSDDGSLSELGELDFRVEKREEVKLESKRRRKVSASTRFLIREGKASNLEPSMSVDASDLFSTDRSNPRGTATNS